ncbi:hypothetical protein AEW19_17950 [Salmonella enterica subsp. enterica serovar Saintpaul]|nr:hypothetical protein AEW19_17950 [Salmonella enterica subsp. enterica serovar Saintpaul]
MEDNFSIYINNKLMITKNKKANKGCRRKVIIDLNQMLLLFNNYVYLIINLKSGGMPVC